MTDIEIVKAYMEIPLDRRKELRMQLKAQVRDNATATILRYVSVMNDVIGGPIDEHSREQKYVSARMVLSYVLTKKGFSNGQIGEVLMKDHSTIIYLKQLMSFDVDHNFKTSAMQLLKKYENRLKEYGI